MTSTFFGINTALSTMRAQQKALEQAGHNVANANTPGYSRQQPILTARVPYEMPGFNRGAGQSNYVGTGVTVENLRRVRDGFLDTQIRQELSALRRWEVQGNVLEQVEVLFMEPTDTGLNEMLNQFFAAWQELAKYPESSPVRTTLVETVNSLAEFIRHVGGQLATQVKNLNEMLDLHILDVNDLAKQIAALNRQITALKGAGDVPNDLMDRRDLLLDELAGQVAVEIEVTATGTVDVYLGDGGVLISGENYHALGTVADEDGNLLPIWGNTGVQLAASLAGGSLEGILYSRDELLARYAADLDTLARGIATTINDAHMAGRGLTGETGLPFFVNGEGGSEVAGARDLYVNTELSVNVSKIAAASPGEGAPQAGDAGTALSIAQLRHQLFNYEEDELVSAQGSGGATTFEGYYKDMVSRLGVAGNQALRMVDNQQALVSQLENRRESLSGVSVDEEMAYMLQYQRVYQAGAKFLSILDEILDTLVNRLR